MFRFEKLRVWQEGRNFVSVVYKITDTFPKEEKFALTDQLRRAVVSIILNIAEGSDTKSDLHFKRYLRSSLGSNNEVVSCLYIALDMGYLNKEKFDILYKEANKIAAMLNAMINSLTNKSVKK